MNNIINRVILVCEKKAELVDRVYQNLAFGLITFGATSIILARSLDYRSLMNVSWAAFIPLLIIPFVIQGRLHKLSEAAATGLFYLYAASYGALFASFMLMYSLNQLIIGIGATAIMFLASIYVARYMNISAADKKLLVVGVISLLAMSVLNIFLRLPIVELIVCVLGMVVMFGMSAYEISELEKLNLPSGTNVSKVSVVLSLSLLSKIVSMLIYVLRFISIISGKNRRD